MGWGSVVEVATCREPSGLVQLTIHAVPNTAAQLMKVTLTSFRYVCVECLLTHPPAHSPHHHQQARCHRCKGQRQDPRRSVMGSTSLSQHWPFLLHSGHACTCKSTAKNMMINQPSKTITSLVAQTTHAALASDVRVYARNLA